MQQKVVVTPPLPSSSSSMNPNPGGGGNVDSGGGGGSDGLASTSITSSPHSLLVNSRSSPSQGVFDQHQIFAPNDDMVNNLNMSCPSPQLVTQITSNSNGHHQQVVRHLPLAQQQQQLQQEQLNSNGTFAI